MTMASVSKYLKAIGLDDLAVKSFKAAGIVTLENLAELDLNHYEALGVEKADDRRKLFLLVQDVKVRLAGEEDKEQDEFLFEEDNHVSDRSVRRSKRLSSRYSSSGATQLSVEDSEDSPSKENRPATRRVSGISARSSRRSSVSLVDDDEFEDDLSSLYEASSPDSVQRNKRASMKLQKQQSSSSAFMGRSKRDNVSTSRQSTSNSRRKSLDSRSLSGRRLQDSSSNSGAESDTSTSSRHSRRKSVATPRTARTSRYKTKLQDLKSSRTGKQLSAIPANETAIMSPLVTISKSKMDADIATQQVTRNRSKRGKSTSSLGSRSRSGSFDSSSGGESASRRSVSSSDSSRRKSTGRQSLGGSARSRRRSSIGSYSRSSSTRSLGNGRRSTTSDSKPVSGRKSAAFVHGTPVDDSWATQVLALREDNNANHELFHSGDSQGNSSEEMSLRVIVRKRPMSKTEAATSGEIDVVHPLGYGNYGKVLVYQPKTRVDLTKEVESIPFAFDNVFGEETTNLEIYKCAVQNLIPTMFDGNCASLFAYGQTGSGKTFTTMGCNLTGINAGTSSIDQSNSGLYFLAAHDVFELLQAPEYRHMTVGVSFFEMYEKKLLDLLNNRKPIKCQENSVGKVCFPGLTEHPVMDPQELMDLIEAGAELRSTGSTSKNADSSRSHAVLQLTLRKTQRRDKNVEHGRLTFIDLAGSERGADTSQASKSTQREGSEINKSLLALKEVIRALASGQSKQHIPFRGSKLTQVLKDSFVGQNSRSVMVACVAPNNGNCEHTLNTLRYANRVKERDAETGRARGVKSAIPTRSEKYSARRASSTLSLPESFSDQKFSDSFVSDVDDDDSVSTIGDGDSSMLLDSLLASATASPVNGDSHVQNESKQAAWQSLIETHLMASGEMLGMLKVDEMPLVSEATEGDRKNMEKYLKEMARVHERQMSLISTLHEALLRYYALRGSKRPGTDDVLSDDSFEDLRD